MGRSANRCKDGAANASFRGWSRFIIAIGEQLQFCIQPQGGFSICTKSETGKMPFHSVVEVFPGMGRVGSTPGGRIGTRPFRR